MKKANQNISPAIDSISIYRGIESSRYFYHSDHLGSSSWITDKDGNALQYISYLPYGQLFMNLKTTRYDASYKFIGKERDSETGFDYFGARYYSSPLGVWLSVDPLAEKYPSLSPYNYCAGNPIVLKDPDGRDPIYAINFWGKVKKIGDDGNKSTGSYLVCGTVAREVKASTKAGYYYHGNLSESNNVMHIPTGQILSDVQQTVTSTIKSGTSPETRVEHGGHTLNGDKTARIWDPGSPMETETLEDGSIQNSRVIVPFKINGKIKPGGNGNMIDFIWHTHTKESDPSTYDLESFYNWRSNGFKGNSFLIDVNNYIVTFFNEKGVLNNVRYKDFIKMGNQEEIK